MTRLIGKMNLDPMKLKIPPFIVFFLALVIMMAAYTVTPGLIFHFPYQTLISRIFLGGGFIVAMLGILAFRNVNTTADPRHPDRASALVTTGVYAYSRNPMYLGMLFVLVGGFIRFGNPTAIVGIVFFVGYLTAFQIKPEEEALQQNFGAEYMNYCRQVRRWI